MPKKTYTPEQIINKLREAEVLLSQGATLAVIWKKIGVSDCTRAIQLDPNSAAPYKNRGIAYKEKGKKAEAIADFEKCLTLTDNP
ncbi:MAG: tetratricopeptide repeat protein, partial [Chloroflexota bacterium]